jgi:hypothetical protein
MTTSKEWSSIPPEHLEIITSHQQAFPVAVGAIAKDLGIIVKKATLSAGISGEIKERFTLAHEIAHFLLHRDKLSDGITDNILYRSSLSDTLEAQANRLAADIIMPWPLMKRSLLNYSDLKDEDKYERLAEAVDVSTTAIKIRLGKI